jgi:phospholipid transport system substrate-binding protein
MVQMPMIRDTTERIHCPLPLNATVGSILSAFGAIMQSRRDLLLTTAAATGGLFGPLMLSRAGWAESDTAQAGAFIKSAGDELSAIAESQEPDGTRRNRVQRFIERTVDVDGVARFCLGRYWRAASTEQQHTYTQLFRGVLMNVVFNRITDYGKSDVRVVTGRPERRDEGIFVPTLVQRTSGEPAHVTWVVQTEGQAPRIVDLVVEGASLRLTVRSDYSAFLLKHNDDVGALLDALRQQLAEVGRAAQ